MNHLMEEISKRVVSNKGVGSFCILSKPCKSSKPNTWNSW